MAHPAPTHRAACGCSYVEVDKPGAAPHNFRKCERHAAYSDRQALAVAAPFTAQVPAPQPPTFESQLLNALAWLAGDDTAPGPEVQVLDATEADLHRGPSGDWEVGR